MKWKFYKYLKCFKAFTNHLHPYPFLITKLFQLNFFCLFVFWLKDRNVKDLKFNLDELALLAKVQVLEYLELKISITWAKIILGKTIKDKSYFSIWSILLTHRKSFPSNFRAFVNKTVLAGMLIPIAKVSVANKA